MTASVFAWGAAGAAQEAASHAHGRLDSAMFWVGALMALTPLAVALGVGGYLWWRRRHGRTAVKPAPAGRESRAE
jgi:hypothetical protein